MLEYRLLERKAEGQQFDLGGSLLAVRLLWSHTDGGPQRKTFSLAAPPVRLKARTIAVDVEGAKMTWWVV